MRAYGPVRSGRAVKRGTSIRYASRMPSGAKPRKFIAVAGNIGAGKSTMVDFLCQTYDFRPFMEPNALNPYLDDFYVDMGKWAFHSQISFLSHKFRLHMELMAEPTTVVAEAVTS